MLKLGQEIDKVEYYYKNRERGKELLLLYTQKMTFL